MQRRFLLSVAILFVSNVALPAQAASFDCANAKKPDEIAVCKHPDLSELDTEMGALWFAYRGVPFMMGASGARRDDADQFLHDRAACGADVTCLRRIYQARIKALKEDFTRAMGFVSQEENGPAVASTPAASALPAPVEKLIEGYASQCRQLGGTLTGTNHPRIMSSDFDGDGKTDYVLNPQNLRCTAAATAFCGNNGCQIDIVASGNGYQKPIVAAGGSPTISQTEDSTNVEVWVDRSNCNLTDREKACWAIYSWKNGKISQNYQARSLPN